MAFQPHLDIEKEARRVSEALKSTFGGLIDYFEARLSVESQYVSGLESLLTQSTSRVRCVFDSVDSVWETDLQMLRDEVALRQKLVQGLRDRLDEVQRIERSRVQKIHRLNESIENRVFRYNRYTETRDEALEAALSLCESDRLVSAQPVIEKMRSPRFYTGLLTRDITRNKTLTEAQAKSAWKDFHTKDLVLRRSLVELNHVHSSIASGFRDCVGQVIDSIRTIQRVWWCFAGSISEIGQRLSRGGGELSWISSTKIDPIGETEPQYNWIKNELEMWWGSVEYFNPRYLEHCRHMIFGVPFSIAGELETLETAPHPYKVALVLLNTFKEGQNVSPNPQAPLLSDDILHRIERNWYMGWNSLPAEYQQVDLFQLLAHFFTSLPTQFIEVDQKLASEITQTFYTRSRSNRDQEIGVLEKVFDTLETKKRVILLKLCELLSRYPTEGGRMFAQPLFRETGQEWEIMLTELIESRTYFDLPPVPLQVRAPRSLPPLPDLKLDTQTGKIPESTLITQPEASPVQTFATPATNNSVSTETQSQGGHVVTRGPREVIQYTPIVLVRPLARFLTSSYVQAGDVLRTSRRVEWFSLQALHISRQALQLIIRFNESVGPDGPTEEQLDEGLELDDALEELEDKIDELVTLSLDDAHNGEEGHRHDLNRLYQIFFQRRAFFLDERDYRTNRVYQHLAASDHADIMQAIHVRELNAQQAGTGVTITGGEEEEGEEAIKPQKYYK